ncbi:MAG: energy transducer TonB [Pseudomonadota bacterium]
MMRGLAGTVVWSCVAAAIGVGLYFIKHEVKEQEARLAELNREIQRNQEAIHVLKAEWSYLNDPARLRQLSEKYLGMKPMAPAQVATLDTLPRDDGPAYAAEPTPTNAVPKAALAVARAEPAKAHTPRPVAVAKTEPAKPVAAPAPVRVAKVQPTVPAATAAAQARRTIVIQSPALAASELSTTSGEAR